MSTQAATESGPKRIDQTDAAFESEFGLESNPSNVGVQAEEVGDKRQLRDLMDESDDLDDQRGADDNLDLLERKATRQKARAERPAIDADLEPNSATPPEGEEAEEEEGEEEEERESGEEGEEGEDEKPKAPGLTAETAQAAFDRLMAEFGDKIEVPYTANGEEKRATLKQLREEHAPGYAGQDGVTRTFQEANRLRAEAEQVRTEAETSLKEIHAELVDYFTKRPADLVRDYIIPMGGADGVRGLYEALTQTVQQLESDPGTFQLHQEVSGLKRMIQQLTGGGQAAKAEPAAGAPDQRDTTTPGSDPYGFVPGPQGGYPPATQNAVLDSVKRLSKAHGLDHNDVVQRWNQRGRDVPVFDVLEQMVATKAADAEKLERAKNPPRQTPKGEGKVRDGKKPGAKRPAVGSDADLESALMEYARGQQQGRRSAAR